MGRAPLFPFVNFPPGRLRTRSQVGREEGSSTLIKFRESICSLFFFFGKRDAFKSVRGGLFCKQEKKKRAVRIPKRNQVGSEGATSVSIPSRRCSLLEHPKSDQHPRTGRGEKERDTHNRHGISKAEGIVKNARSGSIAFAPASPTIGVNWIAPDCLSVRSEEPVLSRDLVRGGGKRKHCLLHCALFLFFPPGWAMRDLAVKAAWLIERSIVVGELIFIDWSEDQK
ncbi:hypothetical protein CEXT_430301 [Caerostris extrusa]|uniref:Uncharacterized protein n=1 Tax=Caerostris extrusa TaxID=172846 RepID=A0AAV4XXF0_CAEEX|nr:hypothetical protein CEXT_430301 [Caerostris extrusa]